MLDRSSAAETAADAEGQAKAFAVDRMRRPTVSVIVTNYNYERFIGDCLGSILAQTVQPDEVIVVDDCSTDGSVAAIERFIAEHDCTGHFELHRPDRNGGQMNAFIEGFQRTSGAFVVFVDADDWLFPDFLETHLAAHLNALHAAGLTCSNEVIVDGENRVLTATIEKWHRAPAAGVQIAPHVPVRATPVDAWKSAWDFDEGVSFVQAEQPLLYVAPDGNDTGEWLWSTTSAIMFRRAVLDIVMRETFRDVRICADFVLLHFAHLIGGTILIQTCHGAYRRHGSNNFAKNATIGRGTRRGFNADHDVRGFLTQIEDELVNDFENLSMALGEPRMLQLLAAFATRSRLPAILASIGPRPIALIQFAGLLVIKKLRTRWLRLRRLTRFV